MMKGFTLIEMLVVIIIIGVATGVGIVSISSYVNQARLRQTTQDLILDLRCAVEFAKSGTQTIVIFGTTTPPLEGTYTGTYTITEEERVFQNPLWGEQTEKKRDMRKLHLTPDIPVINPIISFATVTGFASPVTSITLTSKGKSRYVRINKFGRIEEIK
ncbi:TPA: hypothetical protein DCX16_06315 [bacterium]|nr:hypothetical protein [bacterium]